MPHLIQMATTSIFNRRQAHHKIWLLRRKRRPNLETLWIRPRKISKSTADSERSKRMTIKSKSLRITCSVTLSTPSRLLNLKKSKGMLMIMGVQLLTVREVMQLSLVSGSIKNWHRSATSSERTSTWNLRHATLFRRLNLLLIQQDPLFILRLKLIKSKLGNTQSKLIFCRPFSKVQWQ